MSYRFAEHGGEVELEVTSMSEAGVFQAALDGFAALVGGDEGGIPARHQIELEAGDPALFLADWLNELVYLADVEQFVPELVEHLDLGGGTLRASVAGRRGRPRPLVKAVTLNRLELSQDGGEWHGRVVLDV
jgi:SHS2 domain-containing protein